MEDSPAEPESADTQILCSSCSADQHRPADPSQTLGTSSLVRAGLLPNLGSCLSSWVLVKATPSDSAEFLGLTLADLLVAPV